MIFCVVFVWFVVFVFLNVFFYVKLIVEFSVDCGNFLGLIVFVFLSFFWVLFFFLVALFFGGVNCFELNVVSKLVCEIKSFVFLNILVVWESIEEVKGLFEGLFFFLLFLLFFILGLLNEVLKVGKEGVKKFCLVFGFVFLFVFIVILDGVKGFELFLMFVDVFEIGDILNEVFMMVLFWGINVVEILFWFVFFNVFLFFCSVLLFKEEFVILLLLKIVENFVWNFFVIGFWFNRELFFE